MKLLADVALPTKFFHLNADGFTTQTYHVGNHLVGDREIAQNLFATRQSSIASVTICQIVQTLQYFISCTILQ